MNQIDDRTEPRQVLRLFTGRIATADHGQWLVAKHRQGSIAGRTIGDTLVFQEVLAFQTKMTVSSTTGND
ncbi:hypothetical protein SDC9_181179 [bioreactor metagenome]|uniref:Uncharacterized protein n=1 Tax=bioreactor metagenome TaxID=1076179 RepID=A0A645H3U1_9ZZZZ